jgi:hypothetical protein
MGESLLWILPGLLYDLDFEHAQDGLADSGDRLRCPSADDTIVCSDALLQHVEGFQAQDLEDWLTL